MPTGLALSGRAGFSVDEFQSLAVGAERAGCTHVLATETSSDALASAMAMAVATSRVRIGTSILNLRLRHPVALAMTAAVADDLSDGRLWLGLGVGDRRVVRDGLGLPVTPPLVTVREYVAVVRGVLDGSFSHDGEIYSVKDIQLSRPADRPVPIHVAGLQEGMLGVAGEVGDGVILHLTSPDGARAARDIVHAATRAADRRAQDVMVSCMVPVCVDDDPELAFQAAQTTVLRYALHPVASRVFAASGHGQRIGEIGDLLRAGNDARARRAVDPELARSFVAFGSASDCRDQLRAYEQAGVDLPIAFPMPAPGGNWYSSVQRTLKAIADAS